MSEESSEVEKDMERVNIKPNVDIQLIDLKLVLGPELRIVYPLILNFAVSGELELNGLAHPKWIQPKGILTFENGDVNLVATQVSPMIPYISLAVETASCSFLFLGLVFKQLVISYLSGLTCVF